MAVTPRVGRSTDSGERVRVAINALPVGAGMTGIGAYARALVRASGAQPGRHSFIYVTAKGASESFNGTNGATPADAERILVEEPSTTWEQLHLPGELEARAVDLYHSPLFTCPIVNAVPSVITIHDVVPAVRPDLCSEAFLQFYRSRIDASLNACSWAVAASEFSRREAIEQLDLMPERIHTVHQGIGGRLPAVPRPAALAPVARRRLAGSAHPRPA